MTACAPGQAVGFSSFTTAWPTLFMLTDKSVRLFTTNDFEQLRRLTREGKTIAQAAEIIDFAPTTIYRHLAQDEEWRAQINEDRAFFDDNVKDGTRVEMARRALDPDVFDAQPQISQRALEKLWDRDHGAPQRVEVTGADGGAIEIAPKVVSASEILRYVDEHGLASDIGLDRPQPALPAAGEVRSAHTEPSTGGLPPN